MSGCNGFIGLLRWRPIMGVMAAGVLACSLTLQGAPPGKVSSQDNRIRTTVYKGHPIPVQSVPFAAPVHAYAPDRYVIEGSAAQPFVTAPGDEPNDGIAAALTQNPISGCELDIECDDCNPCTTDTCDIGVGCVNEAKGDCEECRDDLFCDGVEKCDSGTCVEETAIKLFLCTGGPFDGRPCPKDDGDCDWCDGGSRTGEKCCPGVPGSGVGGTCVGGTCSGGSRDGMECCPDGGTCDDTPTCDLQSYDPDPCRLQPTLLCDEEEPVSPGTAGACVDACFDASDCDDGLDCNGAEVCVKDNLTLGSGGYCVGAAGSAGTPCTTDGDCISPDKCGGVCRPGPAPCTGGASGTDAAGYGTTCEEGTPVTCGKGRCCQENGKEFDCSRLTKAACETAGGLWLGVGDLPGTEQDDGGDPPDSATCLREAQSPPFSDDTEGDDFGCPKYSAGLIQGNVTDILGRAGVSTCYPYWEIGDDYELENCNPGLCQDGNTACIDDKDCINAGAGAPCKSPPQYLEVHSFRWIGGHVINRGSRMRLSFYTRNGDFIEDVITEPAFPGGILRRTIVVGEHPVIPCKGIVTIKPAIDFSPDNLVEWALTDDGTDTCATGDGQVGCSDANIYGRPHPEPNPNPDNTLKTVPLQVIGTGRLAMEIVGEKVNSPTGACCSPETGVCELKPSWECRAEGSSFQGIGTQCNVCSNSPFTGCSVDANCFECSGGDRAGQFCCPGGGTCDNGTGNCVGGDLDGLECCPSGSCDKASGNECLPVPPACTISACCDKTTGDCTEVTGGGLCTGGAGTTPCLNDLQCQPTPGGTCEAECPVGSNSRGFGTRCIEPTTNADVNCCPQPTDQGRDNCNDVTPVNIPVPALGQPPVTVTFTSNNKSATFGDYVGDGSGTCEIGVFDPNGATRDRGWWHAFSVNDCADVRIDMCCTGDVISDAPHRPQWSFLTTDCNPCTSTIGNTRTGPGSFPSVPIGQKTADNDRGGPFCTGADDLWQTFQVTAGTYWHPIFSAPGGHFGDYQLHVTVGACREAACCLPTSVCLGGPKDLQTCTTNDDCVNAPGDEVCVGGDNDGTLCCPGGGVCDIGGTDTCNGGSRDGLQCCPGGGECKGNCVADCAVLREAQCDDANGFWQAFPNIPTADADTTECVAGQTCGLGSCCTAPGECVDWSTGNDCDPTNPDDPDCCQPDGSNCMDKKLCDVLGGTFVGGAECTYPTNPCPACEIETANNCHQITTGVHFVLMSDWAVKPGGVKWADDFIPVTAQISQVCTWGTYLDPSKPTPNGCTGDVEDDFVVRIYEDNDGIPGALIAQRDNADDAGGDAAHPLPACELASCPGPVTVQKTDTPLIEPVNGNPITGYTLSFPTINLPAANVTYWLEIANNTHTPAGAGQPQSNQCYWHISSDDPAFGDPYNGFAAVSGSNTNADISPGGRYNRLSGRWRDTLWCIGHNGSPVDINEPDTPVGACCDCAGACTGGTTMYDCADNNPGSDKRWTQFDYGLCQDASTTCMQDRDCGPTGSSNRPCTLPAKSEATCGSSHVCEFPTGDDCGAAVTGSTATGLDCSKPQPQPGQCIQAENGHYEWDIACASTDGPTPISSGNFLGHDVWVCYETDCTGELVMSMCASGIYYGGMDSYMVVYHDAGNPNVDVACPTDNSLIILDGDESCNGMADGGAGHLQGRIVTPGENYLVRMGGWGGTLGATDQGKISLDIACLPSTCTLSNPPALAKLTKPSSTPDYKTNRYLPVRIQDIDGVGRLIRVEALQLPAPYQGTVFEGQQWWAGTPFRVCEKANQDGGTSCQAVPGQPKGRRFNWYAPLVCDQSLAVPIKVGTCVSNTCSGGFADGDGCGRDQDCQVLYLEHEGIVPSLTNRSAIYEVRVIGEDCLKTVADNFSDPLTITQNRLGDFASLGSQCETPVGGNGPGSEDINAITAKFSNLNCQVKKARCDITRVGGGAPDHKCDSVDINAVLTGFSNPTSLPWGPVNPADACGQFGAAATEGIAAGDLTSQEATVANRPVQTTAGGR